ncbi:restriction endonuclease subunit S [Chitinophaga flava]|uniref:Type I restriction modification DNA specificity domain-containing protein n=1 Tax=Chitinophaga flava TaxID=2259036 RepID=A0A365XTW3_9BACT|nr:restriction endonuclease subunit S [Chitinophaga flava]RBL89144.1 hypothetical protein DF182_21680 [Chitinophaga flava]
MKIIEDKYQSTLDPTNSWLKVRQGDIATFYNGRAYKLSEWESSGIPVVRLQNLTGTGNKYYYSNLKLPEHQYCYPGDLLYMWSATLGPFLWKGEKAIYHYHIWKVVVDSSRVDKLFFFYLLDENTNKLMRQSHGSTMLHVTKSEMENQMISLPSLLEQQKIAEALNCVDEKIELIKSQITQTTLLKKGLMQGLFTKGIGHTKFKSSAYGEIPESWEVSCIGKLAIINPRKIVMGDSDDVSFVGMVDVSEDAKLITYNAKKYSEVNKGFTCFKDDDVILAKITPCFENGKGALIEGLINGVGFGSTEFHVIRVGDKVLKEFIYYHTISTEFRLKGERNMTGSAGQRRVPRQFVENYPIGLPPIHEQRKIVEILGTVDEKLAILKEKKGKTELLKRGLMQQLLTGKIRVKVDEEVPIS